MDPKGFLHGNMYIYIWDMFTVCSMPYSHFLPQSFRCSKCQVDEHLFDTEECCGISLPETNSKSPWKMDDWKKTVSFWEGAVLVFWEGMCSKRHACIFI